MASYDNYRHLRQREYLVAHLRASGIRHSEVLDAMLKLPRHLFVDASMAARAYEDVPLPIGHFQTISQPQTVAYMTECLIEGLGTLKRKNVLDVGTGSGYQAALLCALGADVSTIERIRPLSLKAQALLLQLGYRVYSRVGDGTLGWQEHAPYQGIIVAAAAPEPPSALLEQLAPGGRMVIPVGGAHSQHMMVIDKTAEGTLNYGVKDSFRFVPLVGKEGWKVRAPH